MTDQVQAHKTSTSMVKAAPAKVDAGADITLKVKVSCSSACDLQGNTVKVITPDAVVADELALTAFDDTGNETDTFVVKAPSEPGDCTWTAVYPAQEAEDTPHEESSASFSFTVRPHVTSMAVWDVPSPMVQDSRVKIKVGAKCSAHCELVGKEVEVYDQEGTRVATGTLGDVSWQGATALYWTEVAFDAPSTEGLYKWTAKIARPELELPHTEGAYPFVFRVVRPPDHVVTVEVIDRDWKTPVEQADVLLHPYRTQTNSEGVAKLEVAEGEYELNVTRGNFGVFEQTVNVDSDMTIKAEILVILPDPNDRGS